MMAKIKKVLRMEKRNDGDYAIVYVQMEDGLEAGIAIGGECEVYFHKGVAKAFVKRGKNGTAPN